jgi:hypothetical protein
MEGGGETMKVITLGDVAREEETLQYLREKLELNELDIDKWLRNPVCCPICEKGLISFPYGDGWIRHIQDCRETKLSQSDFKQKEEITK